MTFRRILGPFAARAAACVLLAVAQDAAAQERALAWRALRADLDAIPAADRLDRLQDFVARFGADADGARSNEVLTARLRLAGLHLTRLDVDRARVEFTAVDERAPRGAIDLRGSARYGLAQAAELAGDDGRARAAYEALTEEFVGTRYADFAKVALHRLDRPPAQRPQIGTGAPEFGPVLDRGGASRRLSDLLGRPALLIFVDPEDADGADRTRQWIRAARRAGLPDDAMITFASGGGAAALAALAKQPEFRMPIVPADGAFLGPVFLRYEIRGLPSAVLVGPDGTILGRDLPASRLRHALVELFSG